MYCIHCSTLWRLMSLESTRAAKVRRKAKPRAGGRTPERNAVPLLSYSSLQHKNPYSQRGCQSPSNHHLFSLSLFFSQRKIASRRQISIRKQTHRFSSVTEKEASNSALDFRFSFEDRWERSFIDRSSYVAAGYFVLNGVSPRRFANPVC